MVNLKNLISRISVPPLSEALFVNALESKCSPVPFAIITEKTFSLF